MFKKTISVISAVVLIITAVPLSNLVGFDLLSLFGVNAYAYEDVSYEDVYWDDYFQYIVFGGEATISNSVVISGDVVIPSITPKGHPVTHISWSAFSDYCYNVTSFTLPSSLKSIGEAAFVACKNLESITLPNSLLTIGQNAFSNLTKLESITIPSSVTNIGDYAFSYCEGLTNLTIMPGGELTVGYEVFKGCDKLKKVTLPGSLKNVGDGMFSGCDGLESVKLENGVTIIGNSAFFDCINLKEVTIPDSVTAIGHSAFGWCENLEKIKIPSEVTIIGSGAFQYCTNIKDISFSKSLSIVGDKAFSHCNSLETVILPENVMSIGERAFDSCANLKYVHIPESVEFIVDDSPESILNNTSAYICSDTADCYAKIYADEKGIEFRVCNGEHHTDEIVKDNYTVYGREFKHNLDYFIENTDSSKYNPELANLLAALSAAAYDEETIKNAYKELGFDDCETFNYDGVTLGKVAYSLAFKKSDNSDETICLVTVRGTVNNSEWFGNFNISTTNGKHDGFLNATNQIYDNIQNYIDSNNITGDVKYFVTGHSRGAAVGNLLSVGLMENGVASSNVYNYNYACPDVATHAVFPDYNNIFNVCNTADIVSHVPGEIANSPESDSHWGKYGRTHWFTMDIPDTGDILQDIKNDHNVDFYLKYMDQQLDPSEWWYIAPTDNGVIGHTASIQCPVDVVITDESDKNIASVINGEINYYDSAFGDVIILTDGDKKFIYINGDNDFNINLVGTDNGKMTYSIEKYNIFTKETLESKTFENVTLEKGKEMYSPIIGNESTGEVKLYVVDDGDITHRITEDGTEIDYSWVNEHGFEMKSPSTATVKYGDTLVLQADLGETALPEGWSIRWDVDGAGFNMTPFGDGLTCNMTSVANGNATVKTTLVDETGEVVLNAEGNEISAEITLKSNASFWQKIVSFFKNLFRINRIIY